MAWWDPGTWFRGEKAASVRLPKAPDEKPFLDFFDEIGGTKLVTVKDPATGKNVRIVKRIPRSAEDQEIYDLAGHFMKKAMTEISTLYKNDPAQIVHFEPFIKQMNVLNRERGDDIARLTQMPDFKNYVDEFKAMQMTTLEDAFNRQQIAQQESLNRAGYGRGSTASAEMQAALGTGRAKAEQEASLQTQEFAQGLYDQDQTRRAQEYGLREETRQNRLADLQNQFGLQKDYADQLMQKEDRDMGYYGSWFDLGNKVKNDDFSKTNANTQPLLQAQLQDYALKNDRDMKQFQIQTHGAVEKGKIDVERWKTRKKGIMEKATDKVGDTVVSVGPDTFKNISKSIGSWF